MTRLKALELFGFKSFADRTRFEFPDGITVIVGPNGSGKSNVVDAIKWVLGEQSVRSLRGREMADVIFAGSTARKPMNAAETTLVFDNSAGGLPVAAEEVRIGRRVYRSGESEYLINGEVSRLRDIRELFSGTGAATEAYSVIEQGRVDALLVASGRDRRAVFEEAAGITRFRARRSEALRRLERADQNRQRLADIVGEVESRLETVHRQARRARRWRLLSDRLRRLRVAAAARDLAGSSEALADLDRERTALAAEAAEAASELTAAEQTLDRRAADETRISEQLEKTEQSILGSRQQVAAAEATLGQLRSRRDELQRDLEATAARASARAAEARTAAAEASAASREAGEAEAEAERLRQQLHQHSEAVQGSASDAESARDRIANLEHALGDAQAHFDAARLAAVRTAGELSRAEAAAAAARQSLADAQGARVKLAEARASAEGNLEALTRRMAEQAAELEKLETAEQALAGQITAAWQSIAHQRSQLEALRERRRVLEELTDRQEGIPKAAAEILADAKQGPPGLQGLVADLISADPEIAALVDQVLGERGSSLVVASIDDAVAWAASRQGGGRLSLMADAETTSVSPLQRADFTGLPGVIGRLDRLVTAAPQRADLVRRLLGGVWVVETLADAARLLPAAEPETRFVTPTAALLSSEGLLVLGGPADATGLVARRSELAQMAGDHDSLTATIRTAEQAIEKQQARQHRLREQIHDLRARLESGLAERATSRAERERIIREQAAAARAIELADEACRREERLRAESEQTAAAAVAECDTHEAERDRLADSLRAARAAIESIDRSRDELVEQIRGLAVEEAKAGQRAAAAAADRRRFEEAHESRQTEASVEAERLVAARARLGRLELELLQAGGCLAEAAVALENSAAVRRELLDEKNGVIADARAATARAATARETTSRIERRQHAIELERGEIGHQRARITERIREDYGIDVDSITLEASRSEAHGEAAEAAESSDEPIPEDRGELEVEIEALRKRLAGISSVNLEALAEAEELETRHAGLVAQLADVTTAKASIEELISRIDEESRRLLGETIETVRGYFRELFERLFAGGQADIVLDPDADLLETSVEIVARPPGKEPRNISLLSGGEKTMTCVALLLAIFKSRPSPFCVLDEVDAALDEANVDRFTGVLRDFLSSTQFIVVTHSKKTMAAATTLYGITMEESGVSKRVSVLFEAAASQASRAA